MGVHRLKGHEEPIRLQKLLAQAGICSRREGERLILDGRVTVNGAVVTELGTRVDPETDRVSLDGKPVGSPEEPVYILLNKPPGYISSCRHRNEKIVLDLIDTDHRVYPVGRLDKASEGLMLLTNDGRLHLKLSHPSFDHEKEYEVTVARSISDDELLAMGAGIVISGRKTRPARVRRLSGKKFRIVLQEGRNRQIRKMLGALNHEAIRLKRTRMAGVRLGELPPGAWRYLTEKEKENLFNML
jgi:23S rRNA pseudouridine2605 synthase/23S rRNA pseudouridine2604 synthase